MNAKGQMTMLIRRRGESEYERKENDENGSAHDVA